MAKKFNEERPEEENVPVWIDRDVEPIESSPLYPQRPEKKGKFVAIAGNEVIVDVNGNGERIPYVPEKHDSLKAGDEISF